jgi:hypothetical protein
MPLAELAIGHKRTGLDKIYNFDEVWQLRCRAFVKISDHIAQLLDCATQEGKLLRFRHRHSNTRGERANRIRR